MKWGFKSAGRGRQALLLALTIDVEEEGLFGKHYTPGPAPAKNVRDLERLTPLFHDLGIRPTLLVSYQAAQYRGNLDLIVDLCRRWQGEIGAHLHPWNTPPFDPGMKDPLAWSEDMSPRALGAKVDTLITLLEKTGTRPVSFRMGRWNWGPALMTVLRERGIMVDSSQAPMHRYHPVPPVYTSNPDPFYPHIDGRVLEAPLTILPVIPGGVPVLEKISRTRAWGAAGSWLGQHLLSIPAQPKMVGLTRLKAAVRLHRRRGGRVVTVAFHSSEISPGHSPTSRTPEDLDKFLVRLTRYLGWLRRQVGAESVTLSELPGRLFPGRNP